MSSSDVHLFSSNASIVTGNSRLSRIFYRKYDEEQIRLGKTIWVTPEILPREGWLRKLWKQCVEHDPVQTPLLLSTSQELMFWEQVIRQSRDHSILLDAQSTALSAMKAWTILHQWNLSIHDPSFNDFPDTQAFAGWAHSIQTRLNAKNWITSSQLPAALRERVQSHQLRVVSPLILAGFDEIVPADQELFETIRNQGGEVSLMEIPSVELLQTSVVACKSTDQEIRQAALWARKQLEERPDANIGVILPGLASHQTAVERIFDDVLHPGISLSQGEQKRAFHISAGTALSDLPMISTAFQILALPAGVSFNEFSKILRSPYADLQEKLCSVDEYLRRYGQTEVNIEHHQVTELFPDFEEACQNLPDLQSPGQWGSSFAELLRISRWPGSRALSSGEYQIRDRWYEVLSEFARYDLILSEIDYREALHHLKQLTGRTIFGSQDTDAPIQIMDMLEASGSTFDALWIAGLHDQAWPQAAQPNPFLPVALQRKADTPQSSAERELTYATRMMDRLLHSSPQVICSYPLHFNEEELRISSLIRNLNPALPTEIEDDALAGVIYRNAGSLESITESAVPLPVSHEIQLGGVRVLADQSACPFRAFATHRLRARKMEVPETGLTPRERGNIVHESLQAIWQELKSQSSLRNLTQQQRSELLDRCIHHGVETALKNSANAGLLHHRKLEEKRLHQLLGVWLDEELKRDRFHVVATEEKETAGVSGLRLTIKADRIDQYEDGSLEILDYKTSKNLSSKSWDGERLDEPQLPLYAVNHTGKVSSIRFGQVAAGKAGLIPPKPVPVQERIEEWKSSLMNLSLQFQQGTAEVDPKKFPQTCEFCGLQPLCRVDEKLTAMEGDEESNG